LRFTAPTANGLSKATAWEPDIEVVDDPAAMAAGGDPQLERAVAEVMKQLRQKSSRPKSKRRAYPKTSECERVEAGKSEARSPKSERNRNPKPEEGGLGAG